LGGTFSNATAINDSGLIVGSSNIVGSSSISHAVAWSDPFGTSITDLGTLGGASSFASAVNNLGEIVGYSLTAGGVQHATLWDGISIIDLNSLLDANSVSAGWVLTTATGINDSGWIVGNAGNSLTGVSHAFLLSIGSVAAVPESNTYAMALMGLGLIGFISRRCKNKQA
jgi:probable HAF family extracellular repeat protein